LTKYVLKFFYQFFK
jgi:hypothetical protein